ncbi:MAG TPA: DUF2905 family protein [Clostridiales bacterium]|nr:DUF2905 family protein [Clostridiales bacterium]
MESLGKTMILIGALMMVMGFVIILGGKLGLGRLPGDIFYRKGNVTFYFPILTSILLSIVLSILLNLFYRR